MAENFLFEGGDVMVEEFGEIEDFFEEGDGYSSGVVVEDDKSFGFVDGVEI